MQIPSDNNKFNTLKKDNCLEGTTINYKNINNITIKEEKDIIKSCEKKIPQFNIMTGQGNLDHSLPSNQDHNNGVLKDDINTHNNEVIINKPYSNDEKINEENSNENDLIVKNDSLFNYPTISNDFTKTNERSNINEEIGNCIKPTNLPGESFTTCHECSVCAMFLSQYRIVITSEQKKAVAVIPIVALDSIEARESNYLLLNCKDGRILRVKAKSQECAITWFKKLTQIATNTRNLKDIFAFTISKNLNGEKKDNSTISEFYNQLAKKCISKIPFKDVDVYSEFKRLNFDQKIWKISNKNENFNFCKTYPRYLIVPTSMSDSELDEVAPGRFLGRIPTAVWHCKTNGAVLLRSSQPYIRYFSGPVDEDINYIKKIRLSIKTNTTPQNLLIVDARAYTAALANRAKCGGYEQQEYYANTDVEFRNLSNIHHIRYAFSQLRNLMMGVDANPVNFFQQLQATNWLNYIGSLIASGVVCAESLLDNARHVLVHCSDGWDRTTQIVCLTKIIVDPYYRTMKGFEYLIRREWIEFGHKFSDRNGILNGNGNERSPVFLQFLDCVYQLTVQFPCKFEFNEYYLIKLVHHSCSGLFADFLFNNLEEAIVYRDKFCIESDNNVLLSIWNYFDIKSDEFKNFFYEPNTKCDDRLNPKVDLQHMKIWERVYSCSPIEDKINNSEEMLSSAINGISITEPIIEKSLSRSVSAESISNHKNQNMGHSLHSCNTFHESRQSQSSPTQFGLDALISEDGLTNCKSEIEDKLYKTQQYLNSSIYSNNYRNSNIKTFVASTDLGFNHCQKPLSLNYQNETAKLDMDFEMKSPSSDIQPDIKSLSSDCSFSIQGGSFIQHNGSLSEESQILLNDSLDENIPERIGRDRLFSECTKQEYIITDTQARICTPFEDEYTFTHTSPIDVPIDPSASNCSTTPGSTFSQSYVITNSFNENDNIVNHGSPSSSLTEAKRITVSNASTSPTIKSRSLTKTTSSIPIRYSSGAPTSMMVQSSQSYFREDCQTIRS
ncbi:Myotubularin-like phosphatase domain-containing protein [Strongyloides ratti]|uniref:Myotubularin-like phosphatase domain-containing protein n=1 Tax=Strongyloides ratti TaxID=34506 RepID=A0A090LAX4_STRRB|nr:Myotubularin-like phosphatase domain-containing protein [Strongyloides ratti]CEF65253.1 Myotubularin-like phosphatase domain-containing protein [Strongyloides ratti]